MKKNKLRQLFWVSFLAGMLVFTGHQWSQEAQECTEYTGSIAETFGNTDYMDEQWTSVANWGNGHIHLSLLGGNFAVAQPSGMGAQIYVCDAGDFDGDGLPDLMGFDINNNYRLVLIRNAYEDANLDGIDDDGVIFLVDPAEVYDDGFICGPASITVADYNNDGLFDFFFMKDQNDDFAYDEFVASMFINVGTAEDPHFQPYNVSPNLSFTSRFMSAGIYINWAGDHLFSTDIDNDDDMDILVISQDKIFLVRNPGVENFNLDSFEISELSYDQRTGFNIGRGGSAVAADDFDRDGDIDIVGGTVNDIPYLVYYENDGTGNFTRSEIPIPNEDCTGTVAICAKDFNNDGWVDIFGATDRWNAGNEARMWFYKNKGLVEQEIIDDDGTVSVVEVLDFEFRCLNDCNPIIPPYYDVDMSAVVDYDQDGDHDVILADANHSGDYYLIINELANVYALYGEGRSTSYTDNLDETRHAITKVQITDLDMGIIGSSNEGLSVKLYVSNNGSDWEFYGEWLGGDIRSYSNLHEHTFNHFGSRLMWKAILEATEDEMEEYDGASYDTPRISNIEFEYTYVERREYSRTSVATQVIDESGRQLKLIIAGSFYFPGWQGHLRAYDVTSMTSLATSYSELRTITRPDLSESSGRYLAEGVEIKWDAGEILNSRPASDRNIYTAVAENGDLVKYDFTTDNVGILGPILQDQNNDNEGLINFIRGEGRYWKLGDINHSNPVVVGPPKEAASQMGEGYADFMIDYSDRQKVLYVGANDGMLHCFDVLTGEELWGFIPYNLLPRLKEMRAVDSADGSRYFLRNVYVDSSPVVKDVYIDSNGDGSKEWITILVCGQGAGWGSTSGDRVIYRNHYFALDVTDPTAPQPLWEFSHSRRHGNRILRTTGETWSVPVIGKVTKNGEPTWVAFVGSGYDNDSENTVGNYFYAVDLETGEAFWTFSAGEVDTSRQNGWNIPNTIPGNPSIVDIDRDGFHDRVYVGDLDGRIWKIDISKEYLRDNSWTAVSIYEDDDNYPIISQPAVWVDASVEVPAPRIFFGTGGDDRAPDDTYYSFVALLDGSSPQVEWFMGDPTVVNLSESKKVGQLGIGEKVWSDPKIADYIVYFNTLTGSIESVDPCESLAGVGNLYARFIIAKPTSPIGSSAFKTTEGPVEFLTLEIKTRSAVTIGESDRVQGMTRKREVYIQEYDSTIQKLEQPVGALLRVKSWREIFRIIR